MQISRFRIRVSFPRENPEGFWRTAIVQMGSCGAYNRERKERLESVLSKKGLIVALHAFR